MGPGNRYVAEAKKQVFGNVAIDMIAGPSEIGIIADESADPIRLAADLLSQAEHDPNARAMMVTSSEKLASAVSEQIDIQLPTLPRESIARAAIENQGFIAIVATINDAFSLMNTIAPEHLEVQLPDPITYLAQIQNAGSVFLVKMLLSRSVIMSRDPITFCLPPDQHGFSHHWGSMTSLSVPSSFSTAQKH